MNKYVAGTVGSFIAGGVIAAITIVGLVRAQTSPDGSPGNVSHPVTIDYGTTG